MPMDALIALRAAGVGLLLDISAGQLPAVLHWGADLGEVGPSDWEALRRAQQMPVMNNGVDVPLRLALVPEGRAGWMGRPGLSGSRGGRDWSPRFEVVELEVDGQPVTYEVTSQRSPSPLRLPMLQAFKCPGT